MLQAMIRKVDREKSHFQRRGQEAKLARVRLSENGLRGNSDLRATVKRLGVFPR
jgi:hypothetical protein